MELRYHDLRYFLVVRILERGGTASVSQLVGDLADEGFTVRDRASRTVSDAFRGECRLGRVERRSRGVYGIGHLPRTSKHRMIHRVRTLRAWAEQPAADQRSA